MKKLEKTIAVKKSAKKIKNVIESTSLPVTQVAMSMIDPSPNNSRSKFENLSGLCASIKSQGLLQAIILRDHPNPKKKGRYEIICGERRFRAFGLLKYTTIPAICRGVVSDKDARDIMAIENLQREGLTPLEEANSVKILLEAGRDPKEAADMLGRPIGWVLRRAKIADLPDKWLKAVSEENGVLNKWTSVHRITIAADECKRPRKRSGR